jgi:uncharacterized protein (UPF0210 family)
MIDAAAAGTLTFDKLEAMTCVCSVGLDTAVVFPRGLCIPLACGATSLLRS